MSYEVYLPRVKKGKKNAQPQVRLSTASIVLNKLAREKISADMVELAFSREKRIIRICKAQGDNGLALKKTKVHAKGFFQHFGIAEKGKFKAEYDESERALYVSLQDS